MLGLLNPIEGAFVHNIGSVIVIVYASLLFKLQINIFGMTKSLYIVSGQILKYKQLRRKNYGN